MLTSLSTHIASSANLPPEVLARLASNKDAASTVLAADRHLVANFGKAVPLGETQHMYLVVTNRTPMASAVHAWLDTFGVKDVSRLTGEMSASLKDAPSAATAGGCDAVGWVAEECCIKGWGDGVQAMRYPFLLRMVT